MQTNDQKFQVEKEPKNHPSWKQNQRTTDIIPVHFHYCVPVMEQTPHTQPCWRVSKSDWFTLISIYKNNIHAPSHLTCLKLATYYLGSGQNILFSLLQEGYLRNPSILLYAISWNIYTISKETQHKTRQHNTTLVATNEKKLDLS